MGLKGEKLQNADIRKYQSRKMKMGMVAPALVGNKQSRMMTSRF